MSSNTNLQNSSSPKNVCSACGSPSLLHDPSGYCVCTECAVVQNDRVYDNRETFITDGKGNVQTNHSSIRAALGTNIGNQKERMGRFQFHHLQRMQNINRSNAETEAVCVFRQLKTKQDVSISTNLLMTVFRRIYPLLPKKSRSRSITLLCITLFFTECRKHNIIPKKNLNKVLEIYEFDIGHYYACRKAIHERCPDYIKPSTTLLMNAIDQSLGRINEEYHFQASVIAFAQKLIKYFRPFLGEKPVIIAASAIGVTKRLLQPRFNLDQVSIPRMASILQITASTVYTRVRKFPYEKVKIS